jgi:catechol 2,3-dioxygenase-like lactoylglutathione lyase family enzyme
MNTQPTEPQQPSAASDIEVPVPEIDRSIYVMPAFATHRVGDLEASRRWYVEGLGFEALAELPGPSGGIALIHLRRWRYQDLLLVPGRAPDSPPAQGVRLTFSAHGSNLDELAEQARAVGGGTVEGPSPTPWNTRDLLARDPDGYEVVLTDVLPAELRDPEFAQRMEQVRQGMGLKADASSD